MVERVVVNKLIWGDEDGARTEFSPGDVIDTDELGLDEDEVARLDATLVFRARQDAAKPVSVSERAPARRGRGRPRSSDSDEL